ncbi:hypothetical protein P170DRAFT_83921 [Aspergillus steynii IBT 23096]|uniref:Uncharacterized protein n=1 Tax=Aspergillus steynii IBT 23096 TaxID=1392250 RepID=A0A2I2GFQ5_9EURO|nr:uncharacterized protein P170DRAFT_83921 [Aspergillus steynii IBT 23096]PLB51715.1 hypothetical protein P170DRAFT_83921 [Aspergillus steynii IBT 23096]
MDMSRSLVFPPTFPFVFTTLVLFLFMATLSCRSIHLLFLSFYLFSFYLFSPLVRQFCLFPRSISGRDRYQATGTSPRLSGRNVVRLGFHAFTSDCFLRRP